MANLFKPQGVLEDLATLVAYRVERGEGGFIQRICVSSADEARILRWASQNATTTLGADVVESGVQAALSTLMGYPVEWGHEGTHLEMNEVEEPGVVPVGAR